jgi:hypothetical protein
MDTIPKRTAHAEHIMRILTPVLDSGRHLNARRQLLPEAAAQRTLSAVACMPLILIEVPSSAYRRGMLALGKQPREEEETS